MERREFVTMAGGMLVAGTARRMGGLADGETVDPAIRRSADSQQPRLPAEVFTRRLERARAELAERRLDLLFVTPSTNFEYFAGYSPGRSERLIALLIPVSGDPAIVAPSFEVERVRRNSMIKDVRGWEEQENPHSLVAATVARWTRRGSVAVEPSTEYLTTLRLGQALQGWRMVDGSPVTEHLRILKSPEEVALIRQAIVITEDAIAATFAKLTIGMTERDVAQTLSGEIRQRGSQGGGLVQFGPSSALPHGGPAARPLERETVVLIDAGCRMGGYTSDITRTIWFGDAPSEEFTKVFNLVYDAQTAAMELGHSRRVPCQELDRAARRVITDGGYGPSFTHRLGHGMGMDGHEAPYLVEGNTYQMETGNVFTIEPGIYQLEKFGVRIEDDCLVTAGGLEVMSRRPAKV